MLAPLASLHPEYCSGENRRYLPANNLRPVAASPGPSIP